MGARPPPRRVPRPNDYTRAAGDPDAGGRAITLWDEIFRAIGAAIHRVTRGEFIFMLLVILALQVLWPARPKQRHISKGAGQDFLWFMTVISVWSVFLGFYVRGMSWLFETHLSFLRLDLADHWPMWLLIAVAFVVGDLLAWFHHWIRHKVAFLWRFHQVHHAQTEMNLFTDSRVHFVEFLVTKGITFGPFFAMGGDFSRTVFVFGVLQPWYARFYHANIRTNLGPLKYVLVTPQSHRIHHSREPQHQDRNFGNILTIWDRMFGTLYPSYDEYPETGVTDPAFPMERSRNPLHLLANGVRQLIYPFRPRAKEPA